MATIGEKIKLLRQKYEESQEDLSKILGVSDKAISAWETGRKHPRMGVIEKLSKHYHIKKSVLIDDNETLFFDLYRDDIDANNKLLLDGLIDPIIKSNPSYNERYIKRAVDDIVRNINKIYDCLDSPRTFLYTEIAEEILMVDQYRELTPGNQALVRNLIESLYRNGNDVSENTADNAESNDAKKE